MLRTTSPNISVITNWGCPAGCWYCIWEKHPLKNVCPETDWLKLRSFIEVNGDKGKISVSGGGDCLFKYEEHKGWWSRFFLLCFMFGMKVDVHSRVKFYDKFFWEKINRCVVSSDVLQDDESYLKWLSGYTKLRITHVVTVDTTQEMIKNYLRLQKKLHCQFTIKKLVGFDDGGMFDKYRAIYPDIYYLEEGDYNIYYMPNNTITDSFL